MLRSNDVPRRGKQMRDLLDSPCRGVNVDGAEHPSHMSRQSHTGDYVDEGWRGAPLQIAISELA
jgi:hypothetical protein